MAISSKAEMFRINKEAGFFDFSPNTMRFFRARVADRMYPVPNGVVFVESAQLKDTQGNRASRKYTVKYMDENTGRVENVTEIHEYASRNGAHSRAQLEQEKFRNTQG